MKTNTLGVGAALLLASMFTGATAMAVGNIETDSCMVHKGRGYKWSANIDKDSSFYKKDIASGGAIIGPVLMAKGKEVPLVETGVVGIYLRNPSCDPK